MVKIIADLCKYPASTYLTDMNQVKFPQRTSVYNVGTPELNYLDE